MASSYPPKKNTAFTLALVIRDADGDPVTGATALDSERSLDGAAFGDCTNEATEIGTTGIYTLALTEAEMNADLVVVQTKTSTSGAKTAVNVIYTSSSLNDELATAAALTTHDGKLDTVDGVVDAIKVITDAIGSTAAARLALSAGQIIPFTVDTVTNTHTPTTTEFQADDITEVTADHYNGRIVVWTTGALTGQATSISDYALVGGIGQLTVVGMTEAPANNDTGIIV